MPRYLSGAETISAEMMCQRSGLSPEDLVALGEAALLTPAANGRYKPRNVGWARKLARLRAEGWTVREIKAWSRRRWGQQDPRMTARQR